MRSSSNTVKNLYKIFAGHPVVTTDSRNIPENSIFFALRGEKFDGNRYASDALKQGAAYAVVDDPTVVSDDRYILVTDSLGALQQLAAEHRQALGIPILAITGSNGKTTTKELTARIMARGFNTEATKSNLNNHIGVPLTLLSWTDSAEFGIIEMGANHPGEIAALCEIAQPDFGLITNIGRAHLEGFGSPEGVARAKGELFDYLAKNGGKAFYRSDDPVLGRMVAERNGMATIKYESTAAERFENHLEGGFNALNIAAAVSVGRYFGVAEEAIREAVASYIPDNMRSQRVDTGKNTVILDCYNANPSSMRAAIGSLRHETGKLPSAVILGDMGELGPYSQQEHIGILECTHEAGVTAEYLVGPHFSEAAAKVASAGQRYLFADTSALREYLAAHPLEKHFVLVKGSRAVGLEAIAGLL